MNEKIALRTILTGNKGHRTKKPRCICIYDQMQMGKQDCSCRGVRTSLYVGSMGY